MHDFRFADMTEPRCKLSTLGADDLARIGGTVIAQAAADLAAVRPDQRNQIAVREIALDAHHAHRQHTAALFAQARSEEHTSELQSLTPNSYAVLTFTKKNTPKTVSPPTPHPNN